MDTLELLPANLPEKLNDLLKEQGYSPWKFVESVINDTLPLGRSLDSRVYLMGNLSKWHTWTVDEWKKKLLEKEKRAVIQVTEQMFAYVDAEASRGPPPLGPLSECECQTWKIFCLGS